MSAIHAHRAQGVTVTEFNRRTIVGMSLGGLSALCLPRSVIAAPLCVAGGTSVVLPTRLTVDCASKRNFQTFRQNPFYVGLAGAVSLSIVKGRLGTYSAGNLFLFPWVKPKGMGQNLSAVVPANATMYVSAAPIPDATLPVDEYFCRFVLKAPWTSFIGFQVDNPFGVSDASQDWFSNVDQLADGAGVGIDWTSSNLNNAWFGGSHWIPSADICDGSSWRRLIVDGLQQASIPVC
jgi:hypothetical protein